MGDTGFANLGKATERRTLKIFWLVDASGSMSGEKIATVNRAIRDCIPEMQDVQKANKEAEMRVNVIKFGHSGNESKWVERDVDINSFSWTDITDTNGYTPTGGALALVLEELAVERMGKKGLPPLIILMSDGGATDDYEKKLNDLLSDKWGKRSVRIPIAIGDDCDEDRLELFRSPKEGALLKAKNAKELTKLIRWASVTVSGTLSQTGANTGILPPAPQMNTVQLGSQDLDSDDDDDQF